jgi:hypothetical protein
VIDRNGGKVTIKKNLVGFVVMGQDTINYLNYVCDQSPVKVVKYNETPEHKVLQQLWGLKDNLRPMDSGATVAFIAAPVEGIQDSVVIESVRRDVGTAIAGSRPVKEMTLGDLTKALSRRPAQGPAEYLVVIARMVQTTGMKRSLNGTPILSGSGRGPFQMQGGTQTTNMQPSLSGTPILSGGGGAPLLVPGGTAESEVQRLYATAELLVVDMRYWERVLHRQVTLDARKSSTEPRSFAGITPHADAQRRRAQQESREEFEETNEDLVDKIADALKDYCREIPNR